MSDINHLRKEIDGIDEQLLSLFLERMSVARQVADYKLKNNLPVLDEIREKQVIENRLKMLPDKANEEEVREFFSGIMSISRGVQSKRLGNKELENDAVGNAIKTIKLRDNTGVRVVYQGNEGAYSEEALINYFGAEQERFNVLTFDEVFEAVGAGLADYGVLPIENSSAGVVSDVLDLLAKYKFYIVGEQELKIRHCLLGIKGAKLEDICEIYSHEQGFMQCREFLKKYPNIITKPYYNTAVSAKLVSESGDKNLAAIASRRNADVYGLDVICEDINFSALNTTRFVIVSKYPEITEKSNKISVAFSLAHQSGTLHNVISCFAKAGLNLLKIESRPKPERNFEYMFFVDYSGNILDNRVKDITRRVAGNCAEFKFLGNYIEYGK